MRTCSIIGRKEDQINTEEKDTQKRNSGNSKGKLFIVGIGPGPKDKQTNEATQAISSSSIIVGYETYIGLIKDMVYGKEVYSSGMMEEEERAKFAIEEALKGNRVALISSGDPGVYGMAGLILEIIAAEKKDIDIEIIPGIPSANTAAAILGAPLMLDYATISLSDLLVPWDVIEKRITSCASSDMAIALYNPRSKARHTQLKMACDIILKYRSPDTPVGIVRDAGRKEQKVILSTLGRMADEEVDMRSIVIIGNSTTFRYKDWLVTPRGYRL